ncbi:WSC domain-containing protein 2 [Holothuria leucospilota]|uniref:WSC domain-containing protein 2 n=1 Tax=Holothuria leucospilota TaxID=206669 RepID=A0A9Q1HDX0_HOLLE|nr:WSC domain-containing protein 2 [Holothuria leucospilota]
MPKDQYLGCYVDSGKRALAGGFINLKSDNNLRNCTTACNAFNYEVVGLQVGRQCFCGNEQYSRYGRRSEWQCGRLCQGQENQYCGGPYRSAVYKAPIRSKSIVVTRKYDLEHSKRLIIFVYSSIITPSLIACAEACTSSNLCVSFNFCERGQLVSNSTKNCELNTATRDYAESEQFVLDELCIFGQVIL